MRVAAISQEEAARRLGLSLKGYRAYETFREPSLRRLRQIAAAFGLDHDYFIRGETGAAARTFEEHVEAELLHINERLERLEKLIAAARVRASSSSRGA